MRSSVKKPNMDNKQLKNKLPEKKLLAFLFLLNSDQTRYKIYFMRCKKIKKTQKVAWLKNHTDGSFSGFPIKIIN